MNQLQECEDEDECAGPGAAARSLLISAHIYNIYAYQYLPRCPHGRCVNTDPGYHCVCDPHYIPTQDRRGCMDGRQGTCYTKYLHYILYTLIYRVSQKRLS